MNQNVRVIPLGGLGEIGMNCMALECEGKIVVVDCGVTFDHRDLGVDVIHADMAWLIERKAQVKALVLTHGHEDHIGAVGYFLRDLPRVPVHAPPYTARLVQERLREQLWNPASSELDMHIFRAGDVFHVGPFEFEPYSVTHSMNECTGLIIRTPVGVLLHTGDFKIDRSNPSGEIFDFARLERLRDQEGIRLLFSDSTNALTEGASGTEADVIVSLEKHVRNSPHRAIVSLFASNGHRLAALFGIARRTGRKIAIFGRSVDTHVRVLSELKMMPDPYDVLVTREQARKIPRNELMIAATGSQGEPQATLARLASDIHPDLSLTPGDDVILSSRIIPGNERSVFEIIAQLEQRGVRVIHRGTDASVHASGHAHRDELREVFRTVQPQSFIPVHGTFLHLRAHRMIAQEEGVPDTHLLMNGDVYEVSKTSIERVDVFQKGRIYESNGEPLDQRVLHDRHLLGRLGVVFVSLHLGTKKKGFVEMITRGVIDEELDRDLLLEGKQTIEKAALDFKTPRGADDNAAMRDLVRKTTKRFFADSIGRKPLIYVNIHRG